MSEDKTEFYNRIKELNENYMYNYGANYGSGTSVAPASQASMSKENHKKLADTAHKDYETHMEEAKKWLNKATTSITFKKDHINSAQQHLDAARNHLQKHETHTYHAGL